MTSHSNHEVGNSLKIEYLPVESLTGYPRNARTHSKHQIRQIARSIKTFGYTTPILINAQNTIIAGHGRIEAAKLLGMESIPTIRLENLTEVQIRAYILADNRLAENAGWDDAILKIELKHILTMDADFDLTVTGFEIPEVDLIIGQGDEEEDKDDDFAAASEGPVVTEPGCLWQLGQHRIFCGSSLEDDSYTRLLEGRNADLIFSDCPYNVKIEANVSGKGIVKHANFAMASGEMTKSEFTAFLTTSLGLFSKHSKSGSVHFICMDWRSQRQLLDAGETAYDTLLNVCVWAKENAGQGSLYRSQHEMVYVFKKGKAKHTNNIQLGKYGRYRSNVWRYAAPRGLKSQRTDEGNLLALHPTVKPVQLVADAILDCSKRGDLVLDGFLGSGSTLIAAERTGRICYGIELEPRYVDVAVRRWQAHTGDRAIDMGTGKSFDELAEEVRNGR